jgi:endoglucanase
MITPKGGGADVPAFSWRSQAPYLGGVWLTIMVVWFHLWRERAALSGAHIVNVDTLNVRGFMLLALWGTVFMLFVFLTYVASHLVTLHRLGMSFLKIVHMRALPVSVSLLTIGMYVLTSYNSADRALIAATWLNGSVERPTGTARAHGLLSGEDVSQPAAPAVAAMDLPPQGVAVGAYDPWLALSQLPLGLEHWYVHQDEPELLAGALAHARNQRTVMVTVEPFPTSGQKTPVLTAILAGERDAEIRQLAGVARAVEPQVVLLRWGHEMDLTGLYPWSTDSPASYRAAYRRVVDIFREEGATNVRWIWSPAGNSGAEAFYPGDDVVDYVGLTILGDAEWDRLFGYPPRSFAELLRPKYRLGAAFGKPIVVAELGVSGPPERQRAWMAATSEALSAYPQIRAISYFNDVNVPNNHLPTQPDWRIAPDTFREFATALASLGGG